MGHIQRIWFAMALQLHWTVNSPTTHGHICPVQIQRLSEGILKPDDCLMSCREYTPSMDRHGHHFHWKSHETQAWFYHKIHAGGHRKQIRQKLLKKTDKISSSRPRFDGCIDSIIGLLDFVMFMIWWHMMTTRRYPGEKCFLCFWCCSNMSKKQDHANNLSWFLPEQPQNIAIQQSNPMLWLQENSLNIERKAAKEPSRHRRWHSHKSGVRSHTWVGCMQIYICPTIENLQGQ